MTCVIMERFISGTLSSEIFKAGFIPFKILQELHTHTDAHTQKVFFKMHQKGVPPSRQCTCLNVIFNSYLISIFISLSYPETLKWGTLSQLLTNLKIFPEKYTYGKKSLNFNDLYS